MWPVAFHILGCFLSPWGEPRMFVPVMPFVIHAIINAIPAWRSDDSHPQASWTSKHVFICFLFLMQSLSYASYSPDKDIYAQEFYKEFSSHIEFIETQPLERVFLSSRDYYAISLLSGKSCISICPGEWKNTNTLRFLQNGGSAILLEDPVQEAKSLKTRGFFPIADLVASATPQTIAWCDRHIVIGRIGVSEGEIIRPDSQGTFPRASIHPNHLPANEPDLKYRYHKVFNNP